MLSNPTGQDASIPTCHFLLGHGSQPRSLNVFLFDNFFFGLKFQTATSQLQNSSGTKISESSKVSLGSWVSFLSRTIPNSLKLSTVCCLPMQKDPEILTSDRQGDPCDAPGGRLATPGRHTETGFEGSCKLSGHQRNRGVHFVIILWSEFEVSIFKSLKCLKSISKKQEAVHPCSLQTLKTKHPCVWKAGQCRAKKGLSCMHCVAELSISLKCVLRHAQHVRRVGMFWSISMLDDMHHTGSREPVDP